MYRRSLAALAAAGAFTFVGVFAGAASAQQTSVGVSAGTPGLGLELGYDLNETFGLRANGNWFSLSKDVESDNVNYDGKLKLFSMGLLGDFYMFDSGFRLTGGAYYNNNHANINATPSGTVTIGGTPYAAGQIGTLKGRVDYNEFTPYAGLGYTTNRGQPGLSLVFDAGVMFQGRPEVTLAGTGPATASPTFAADIERERQQIADDLKWTRFYPAVRVGLAYRF
ncbi:MAG: hypothetical protein AB7I36_08700 [Rhodospirillaceae bacterium]